MVDSISGRHLKRHCFIKRRCAFFNQTTTHRWACSIEKYQESTHKTRLFWARTASALQAPSWLPFVKEMDKMCPLWSILGIARWMMWKYASLWLNLFKRKYYFKKILYYIRNNDLDKFVLYNQNISLNSNKKLPGHGSIDQLIE